MCDVVYVMHLDLLSRLPGIDYFGSVAEFERNLHAEPVAVADPARYELHRALGVVA